METRIKINNPQTQITKYGTYTPAFFEGRFRYDVWISDSTKEESLDAIMCLDHSDLSPVQTNRTYEQACNCHCCFASYGHTVALCNDRNKK